MFTSKYYVSKTTPLTDDNGFVVTNPFTVYIADKLYPIDVLYEKLKNNQIKSVAIGEGSYLNYYNPDFNDDGENLDNWIEFRHMTLDVIVLISNPNAIIYSSVTDFINRTIAKDSLKDTISFYRKNLLGNKKDVILNISKENLKAAKMTDKQIDYFLYNIATVLFYIFNNALDSFLAINADEIIKMASDTIQHLAYCDKPMDMLEMTSFILTKRADSMNMWKHSIFSNTSHDDARDIIIRSYEKRYSTEDAVSIEQLKKYNANKYLETLKKQGSEIVRQNL